MNCDQVRCRLFSATLEAKPYLKFAHSSRQRRDRSAERRQLNASRIAIGIKRSQVQIIENIEEVETHINFCVLSQESRSEEHTSELQSQSNLVCRLLLEKK